VTSALDLSAAEVDALREVANIGSGHAATALSQLTGMTIMIDVPEISVVPPGQIARRIGTPSHRVVTLSMRMLGDLTGQTLFVMEEGSAGLLCDVLLHRDPGVSGVHGEMEQSSLKETGNIMAGSFLNALSACIGKMLLPSVPVVMIERSDFLDGHGGPEDADSVLVVETMFQFDEADAGLTQLKGVFLFVLDDEASLDALFSAIRGA